MLQFDIRKPTTEQAIAQYIGSYKTPEAALADTEKRAPGGLKYLRDNYQALTGDFFADPFEDAIKTREDEAYNTRMSAATGGRIARGQRVRGRSQAVAQSMAANESNEEVAPLQSGITGPTFTPTASHWSDREIQREQMRNFLARNSAIDQLGAPELQLSTARPTTGVQFQKHLGMLEKRMAVAGASDLFRKIDPILFSRGTSPDDPRFARVQGGKDGKIEASDALHAMVLDPDFKRELKRNPQKARDAYYAATNGRDYDTDIAAEAQLRKEQTDERKEVRKKIEHPFFDETEGKWYDMKTSTDPITGKMMQNKIPLDTREAAVMNTGEFGRQYGVDFPQGGGLKPYGESAEEQQAHRDGVAELVAKGIPFAQADAMVKKRLYDLQQTKLHPPEASPAGTGFMDTMAQLNFQKDVHEPLTNVGVHALNILKSQFNLPSRIVNAAAAVAGRPERAPLIPNMPLMNISEDARDIKARRLAMDMMMPAIDRAAAGFTGTGQSILPAPARRARFISPSYYTDPSSPVEDFAY